MSPLVGDLPLMLVPLSDGPLDAASRDASRLRRLRLARNPHALRATNTASQPGASHFWRLEIGASGMVSTNPVRHATGVGLWSRRAGDVDRGRECSVGSCRMPRDRTRVSHIKP